MLLFCFALALACVAAVPSVSYQAPILGCDWSVSNSLSQSQAVTFTLSIRESATGLQKLRKFVTLVSDPRSSVYGTYMTSVEVEELTRPSRTDISVVTSWLDSEDVNYTVVNHRDVRVMTTVGEASQLLTTNFRLITNDKTQLLRATAFSLPAQVHEVVGAVFGLHGLPLPAVAPLTSTANPVDVTPAVLASTYSISGVTPSGSTDNRQAVAEFQGQYMKPEDLTAFFSKFVPNAQAGDDKVYKFVGSTDQDQAGVEASLDIQYIMGVAPGIKTDFWLFAGQDFCLDLKNWTDMILATDTAPRVHSVSYGWQGNLSQVGCTDDAANYVDANFVKLAAKGITIIISSGDSGSGYAPAPSSCDSSSYHQNTAYQGKVSATYPSIANYQQCCQIAGQRDAKGFMYQPPAPPGPGATCSGSDIGTPNKIYTGSTPAHTVTVKTSQKNICCEIARNEGPYFNFLPNTTADEVECQFWTTEPPSTKAQDGTYSGKADRAQQGNCTLFSEVTGSSSAPGAVSGSPTIPHEKVIMWPSWPASSPYVTSVGATRFVGQQVGNPEMATDQFGSGGGFSFMFDQTNAQWQVDATKQYLDNPPDDPTFPPVGSFPPNGRGTPDVSALGEGYQVFVNGNIEAVGGTSASAPAFAGMIALMNEARVQKNKPVLGFLNPFLYQNADAFTDCTLGTNAIGRGTGPLKYGFNATKGWDPATGLGSPIFDKLLDAALQ